MFIGRQRELKLLNDNYNKPGFSMTVIYGRRRIGKSTLISEFIRDKRSIYYTATKVGHRRNMELLTEAVLSELDPGLIGMSFDSLDRLLAFITGRLPDDKLVLVIDELPYWADKSPELLSVLQKYIDTEWQNKNIQIILCGSALSFMEDKVLSEKSPLFGRRDSQIYLKEFNYQEAAEFVPDYSAEDKAICFGVTGGVPKYLSLIDPDISIDDNIKKQFFDTGGYLFDEPTNLLSQEFTDVTLVSNIIEQIASGKVSLKEISDTIHESEVTILYSLNKLIKVGLVEKKHCITEEKNKKKVQYIIKDTMFRFWYRFVPKAISLIEIGKGYSYYDTAVKPQLHDYMGGIFEEMCRYYMLANGSEGKFGSMITDTGIWWGIEDVIDSDGQKKRLSADIDLVALSSVDKTIITGECKFRNAPVDKGVLDVLVRRTNNIANQYKLTHYALFSLGGFASWFDEGRDDRILKFTLDDLYDNE